MVLPIIFELGHDVESLEGVVVVLLPPGVEGIGLCVEVFGYRANPVSGLILPQFIGTLKKGHTKKNSKYVLKEL